MTKKEKSVTYTPLFGRDEVTLSIAMVQQFIGTRSRSGAPPTETDCLKFIMLCKAQGLDPWQEDAYLIGYDTKDGTKFSMIVAHSALLKRAEAAEGYAGKESGVIVSIDGHMEDIPGTVWTEGDLVGGWCKVYRDGRKVPEYKTVKLSTYSTGRSRWAIDEAGMIVKVAEAAALRHAFPLTIADLHIRDEMQHMQRVSEEPVAKVDSAKTLNEKLKTVTVEKKAKAEVIEVEPEDDDSIPVEVEAEPELNFQEGPEVGRKILFQKSGKEFEGMIEAVDEHYGTIAIRREGKTNLTHLYINDASGASSWKMV